jgi:sporulation protein YlmC with PRC-barrel domain
MRMRYYELVGKRVLASDGRKIGHVADLVAEAQGETLCVTALLVGPTALARRITFKRSRLFRELPPLRVPWQLVERIDEQVHLRVTFAEVETVGSCAAVPVTQASTAVVEQSR